MMTTDKQSLQIQRFQNAFEKSLFVFEVDKGAVCISTPFLDWQGVPTKIYVTKDGRVTDGGTTVNLLRALRSIDQLEGWPFLSDFLSKYCISFDGASMMLNEKDDDCWLRYAQGISRLPSYFEPKPIYTIEDRFPERVKSIAVELIEQKYPKDSPEDTQKWASSFIRARHTALKNGYSVTSDLSPVRMDRMAQIISHSHGSPSDRKAHVQSKLLDPTLWKRENEKGEVYAVLEDIGFYPSASQKLLENETTQVVELKNVYGKEQLVDLLVS